MRALLDPAAKVKGPRDMPMRRAEHADVMHILRVALEQPFNDVEEAKQAFASASGGGFGIPFDVVETVLKILESPSGTGGIAAVTDTKMVKTVGEHWVCATLARHGWAPALTRDGLERTDILAVGTHLPERPTVEIQG